MPNYKRIIPRPPELDGRSITRTYLNSAGDLVIVYSGGNIVTVPGVGSGGGPPAAPTLDGGFAGIDHLLVLDAGDASYVGAEPANGGGAYNSL